MVPGNSTTQKNKHGLSRQHRPKTSIWPLVIVNVGHRHLHSHLQLQDHGYLYEPWATTCLGQQTTDTKVTSRDSTDHRGLLSLYNPKKKKKELFLQFRYPVVAQNQCSWAVSIGIESVQTPAFCTPSCWPWSVKPCCPDPVPPLSTAHSPFCSHIFSISSSHSSHHSDTGNCSVSHRIFLFYHNSFNCKYSLQRVVDLMQGFLYLEHLNTGG